MTYKRQVFSDIYKRIQEPRKFLQVVLGPRQVGKTTSILQLENEIQVPFLYVSSEDTNLKDGSWLETQWQRARALCDHEKGAILAIDEIQKINTWSETVKANWDADTRKKVPLKVIVLGSSPLLMGHGLSESLAGRFENLHATHWSYSEMRDAFGFKLEEFFYFGGYPGPAHLREDEERWKNYIRDSVFETTLTRDILLMTRIEKPALLRRLFFLSCEYAGQILSFNKMLGQLQDAGNTTTLAHYLELLGASGLCIGLPKFSDEMVRKRASSPKLIVLNSALQGALLNMKFHEAMSDPETKGHLVENAVGAHLWNSTRGTGCEIYYWNESNTEVDFILRNGKQLVAFEVKSGRKRRSVSGLIEFKKRHPKTKTLIIGTGGIPLEEFFHAPGKTWAD